MTTTRHAPPASHGPHRPPAELGRRLRSVFWDRERQRARAVWLILVPVVGAYVALIAVEVVAAASGVPVQIGFVLMNLAALATLVGLVVVSRRYLGGRRVSGYGLVIDRRWRIDFVAGLGIGLAGVSIPFMAGVAVGWLEIGAVFERGELALLPGSPRSRSV
jgi:hypothetical protein